MGSRSHMASVISPYPFVLVFAADKEWVILMAKIAVMIVVKRSAIGWTHITPFNAHSRGNI